MSTNINITVGDNALLDAAKQQQAANRQAQLNREASRRLEAQATAVRTTALAAQGRDANGSLITGAPFTQPQIDRRPAASRQGTSFVFTPTSAPTVVEGVKVWPQASRGLRTPITFGETIPPVDPFGTVAPSSSFYSENAFVIDASLLTTVNPQGNVFSRAVVTTGLQRTRQARSRKISIQLEARACEAISYGVTSTSSEQLRARISTGIDFNALGFTGLTLRASSVAISGSPGQTVPIPLPPSSAVSTQLIEVNTTSGLAIASFPASVDTFKLIQIEFSTKETLIFTLDGTPTTINVPLNRQAVLENLLVATEYFITVSGYVELGSSLLPTPSPPSINPALKNLQIKWQ